MIIADNTNINSPVRHIKGKVELYEAKPINHFDAFGCTTENIENITYQPISPTSFSLNMASGSDYGSLWLFLPPMPQTNATYTVRFKTTTSGTEEGTGEPTFTLMRGSSLPVMPLFMDLGNYTAEYELEFVHNGSGVVAFRIDFSGVSTTTGYTALFENFEVVGGSSLKNTFNYDDALKQITIDRAAESKFFGFGVCQKLNVKLRDVERLINPSTDEILKVYLTANSEYVNIGSDFYITEKHRDENTNELSITAYDAIKMAEKHMTSEIIDDNNMVYYTIEQFALRCATLLGLGLDIQGVNDESFDTQYFPVANFEGTETIREALNAIAEATQTIYYVACDKLVFKRLGSAETALTITKADYIELDSKTNRRLSTIVHATELGDNVSASLDATGSTQYVRNNPFWELRDDIGTLVDNALAAIGGLTINQFECSWRGNYLLEIGDKIELITKDNDTVTSYLLDDTIEYNGSLSQKTRWSYEDNEGETASNPTSLGEALKQTYARVDKVNKQIDIVASETNANSSAISALQINTESISSSVTKLQEDTEAAVEGINGDIEELSTKITQTAEDVKISVKKEVKSEIQEEGVNKVTTETGFTFNEEGLTVSKNDSSITTTITEDGMVVKRDNTPVLTADNTGVNAMNLHATTYLFIGKNSRFQDYANDTRTGCFWIGK